MNETENVKKSRSQLEKEKTEAESRIERFKSELRTQQDKYVHCTESNWLDFVVKFFTGKLDWP